MRTYSKGTPGACRWVQQVYACCCRVDCYANPQYLECTANALKGAFATHMGQLYEDLLERVPWRLQVGATGVCMLLSY
jgi:hypothetical protein